MHTFWASSVCSCSVPWSSPPTSPSVDAAQTASPWIQTHLWTDTITFMCRCKYIHVKLQAHCCTFVLGYKHIHGHIQSLVYRQKHIPVKIQAQSYIKDFSLDTSISMYQYKHIHIHPSMDKLDSHTNKKTVTYKYKHIYIHSSESCTDTSTFMYKQKHIHKYQHIHVQASPWIQTSTFHVLRPSFKFYKNRQNLRPHQNICLWPQNCSDSDLSCSELDLTTGRLTHRYCFSSSAKWSLLFKAFVRRSWFWFRSCWICSSSVWFSFSRRSFTWYMVCKIKPAPVTPQKCLNSR